MVRRVAVLALLFVPLLCLAQAKRPFTFEDMMNLKRVGEPIVSPEGKWVAFSAVEVNLAENKKTPHLWIVPLSGGEARQLTSGQAGEDRPRFSPEGLRLAYVSAVEGSSQIWTVGFEPATGTLTGEPKKITNISTEGEGEIWSPDGASILFVSQVYPDCKDDACNKKKDEERAKSPVKASIFTRLFYRHWNHYYEGKRSHLFVAPAEGGEARDLTPGDHDVPPFALGGQDRYAFSPDGREVAYTSNVDEVEATSTNNEIFVVPTAGGKPKKISVSKGSDSTPLYSPDGKYIAWRMQVRPGYEADRFRLVIYNRATGKITNLTEQFDRWVGSIVWAPDSKRLYFTAEDKGESPIYTVPVKGGKVQEVVRGHNDDLAVTPDGEALVYSRVSAMAPSEIYTLPLDSKSAVALTKINEPVLSKVTMQPLEPFWFTGSQQVKVQGFLVKPPDFDAKKKYPAKFLIHGGPQGAWGDSWSYRWNAELFAANGYVVIMVNPRGSTGYGQKFIDDINGDWGGRVYLDLMLGLDYAERKYPFIDKTRECALGASYGGYMANWLEGHTTRFKCLVSHDGMFNSESAWGSTEELWFNEWEFRGTPWTNRALYEKWSPHMYANAFKTPMLVVHSQKDYRLDVSEGFQLFTTLQRMKVPSKMLYFPDEGHWVLKPQNSQLWWKTVNDWVDQWTKKSPGTP
ncbi:MAG: S9 family peptidase [Acidobacteriia bacterium]|nr:S9 family peptidase [Terriglobia bacterium]